MNQELYTMLYVIVGLIAGSAISLYSVTLICLTWKAFFLLSKMFFKQNKEDGNGRFMYLVNFNIFDLDDSSFIDEIKKKNLAILSAIKQRKEGRK